ncbi:argininosuccinate lyase [Haladaptatus sp. AB618]|uniref:argininosuccinate lyase n=1 Tax=Haladaptatus sp. AB618 TaxID=2934173 RepID=UPI00209BF82A|nr:argininosuccinate lyase [Haladaptatus sp. AB618]MCO8252615.1 argininosuccinate lyase [Haladaptatus sp. AB618]
MSKGDGAESEENQLTGDGDVVRGDRFSGGPARGFLSSLAADERIFAADLDIDRAHVVMLAEQGIIEDEIAGDILTALNVVEVNGHDSLPEGEDVHAAIETAVVGEVGHDGGKMHTARSRNDEVATCIRYRLREDVLALLETTLALRSALLEVAESNAETVMPGYTHLQPAQPTTVGHFLASYEQAVSRDTARLLDAYGRINQCPLGAAAFAGTPFDVDRERVAELLGFDALLDNSMDAVSTRDFLVETIAAAANLATTVSGLAEDLVIYSNRGFVELSDDYASTSSIMPQKKNPDTLELARAVAGDAHSGLSGLLTTLKGLPRAYNRDLQRATPHAWDALDAVIDATDVAAGAVATATWNEDALADAAGEGFSTATGVADLLAMCGVPFRTAHEVVATAGAGDYDALDAAAEEVLGAPLAEFVAPEEVESALDVETSVAMRDSVGGPAAETVVEALANARATLVADETTTTELAESLEAAGETLQMEVNDYA